jgi:carboxyl-terminal processing protease
MLSSQRLIPAAAALVLVVGLLVLGIWLGGHPADLPGFLRSGLVGNHETLVVDEAIDRIAEDYYRPISRSRLASSSITGLIASLGDRFSHYLSPSEFKVSEQPPRFTGIGVAIDENSRRRGLLVARVFNGSPAERAGVKAGEVIVSVNGHSLAGLTEAAGVALIKGLPGTSVVLKTETPVGHSQGQGSGHGLLHTETIVRAVISEPVVASETRTVDGVKLGVVELAAFTEGAHGEVREAVEQELHKGARGIVLDLRGNGGGLVEEAQLIASIFIPKGTIVTTRGRAQPTNTLLATGDAISTAIPVVVLVDQDTASAAEIVTAALQDHGRAVVVGTHTFGKGVYQEQEGLSNGGALDITVGEYFTPDGRNLGGGGVKQGAGVIPEVRVASDQVDTEKGLSVALSTLVKKVK